MSKLDAAEIMYTEIKPRMKFNKTTEFRARRNDHLYGITVCLLY